jgi:hypothetical protein
MLQDKHKRYAYDETIAKYGPQDEREGRDDFIRKDGHDVGKKERKTKDEAGFERKILCFP